MTEESEETADLAVADPNEAIYLIRVNAPVRRRVAVIAAQPWERGFRSGAFRPAVTGR
jgi:DNA-binding IclR family transcriptional regulator